MSVFFEEFDKAVGDLKVKTKLESCDPDISLLPPSFVLYGCMTERGGLGRHKICDK
jgi:hypothetical protein